MVYITHRNCQTWHCIILKPRCNFTNLFPFSLKKEPPIKLLAFFCSAYTSKILSYRLFYFFSLIQVDKIPKNSHLVFPEVRLLPCLLAIRVLLLVH